MGHHGIYGKGNGTFPQNMFETSVKVPALICCPGLIPGGTELEAPVSHYDIFPTIMDLLGMEKPADLPGRSWRELLEDPEKETDRPVVIFSEYGPVRMIRQADYKYIHRYPYGPHELYNLKEDPEEFKNLYGFSEFAEISQKLKQAMREWFLRYSRAEMDGRTQAVYGKGQCDIIGNKKGCEPFRDDMLYFPEAKDSLKDFSI